MLAEGGGSACLVGLGARASAVSSILVVSGVVWILVKIAEIVSVGARNLVVGASRGAISAGIPHILGV